MSRKGMLAIMLAAGIAPAGAAADELLFDPTELNFDDLINTTITSVSKKAERLQDAAAAVFVLTNDDIRRSHATTIPDLLRLVPGAQVLRTDSGTFQVSLRGFAGNVLAANKLLVLIDGRSIYNPLFGGVIWQAQDVVFEDIERIEVLRGPGGTLWGNNAVNGVINIITKSAEDTQGGLLVVGAGSEEKAISHVRYGGKLGDVGHYRAYFKHRERGSSFRRNAGAKDDLRMNQGGFLAEFSNDARVSHTIQGDFYDNALGPPTGAAANNHYYGGNLLYRTERDLSGGRSYTFQTYWDYTQLDVPIFNETRDTLDFDFQMRHDLEGRHDLIWGVNYRHVGDHVQGFGILPVEREDTTLSGFVQDEIEVTGKLTLVAGVKVEENDYSGGEVQPNLRFSYAVAKDSTWWGAVSRAVRVPTRLETDIPGFGDKGLGSEVLIAYETGFRSQIGNTFSYDLTAYLHDYDELIYLVLPRADNNVEAKAWGLEMSARWQPNSDWQVDTTYTWLQQRFDEKSGKNSATSAAARAAGHGDPANRLTIFSKYDISEKAEFDTILRYKDDIYASGGMTSVPSYVELDLGFTFRARADLALSIAGRNLLDNHHPEGLGAAGTGARNEVQRSVHGTVTWQF